MGNTEHQYALSRTTRSVFSAGLAIVAIALLHFTFTPSADRSSVSPEARSDSSIDPAPGNVEVHGRQEIETLPRLPLPAMALSADTQTLVDSGGIEWTRQLLLERATEAVIGEDDNLLAGILAELGELSLIEADIDTAEMYLSEALDLFVQLENEVAEAGVYMQMGRLHLHARQRARVASSAYDTLLVSRWRISHGQFYQAEADLLRVADNNLRLQRYGAAASTYQTLYRGYLEVGDTYQAQVSGIEAIKLYASSGRMFDAQALQQKMINQGIDQKVFEALAPELARLKQDFENSVRALGAARDQEQLYNQLQARGDVVNAWRFRQQSHATLAKASKRAQYRSQPDVLAELYRSNKSMKDAHQSLSKASELFYEYGFDTSDLQNLQREIY